MLLRVVIVLLLLLGLAVVKADATVNNLLIASNSCVGIKGVKFL